MDRPRRSTRGTAAAPAAPPPSAAPYVRPQQSADSPAASLPTETLAHILAYTLVGSNPRQCQTARLLFGKVAVHWWAVAEVNKRAVVFDSLEAQKLGEVLRKSKSKAGELVQLAVTVEKSGAGRGARVAALLRCCTKVEVLDLRLLGGTQLGRGGEHGQLGKPLHDALISLKELRTVALHEGLSFTPSDLFALLGSWPKLTTFRSRKLYVYSHLEAPIIPTELPALTSLTVRLGHRAAHPAFLAPLLNYCKRSLKHVYLGRLSYFSQPEDLAVFLSIAPSLRTLHLLDGERQPGSVMPTIAPYLDTLLQKLDSVRSLKIGLEGHDTSMLFQRLTHLRHLKTFKLVAGKTYTKRVLRAVTAADTLTYLLQATKLRELTLPRKLGSKYWSAPEVALVASAAAGGGVKLKFGL